MVGGGRVLRGAAAKPDPGAGGDPRERGAGGFLDPLNVGRPSVLRDGRTGGYPLPSGSGVSALPARRDFLCAREGGGVDRGPAGTGEDDPGHRHPQRRAGAGGSDHLPGIDQGELAAGGGQVVELLPAGACGGQGGASAAEEDGRVDRELRHCRQAATSAGSGGVGRADL